MVFAASLLAQTPPEPLFPAPFVVEHHIVQSEADGSVSATEPVTDYYGGSWIVSVRPDESRLVVDFTRRETTEIRPAASTYSVLGFNRLAELRGRLHSAREAFVGGESAPADAPSVAAGKRTTAAADTRGIQIEELRPGDRGDAPVRVRAAGADERALVRLRVSVRGEAIGRPALPPIEVWCDRRVLLSARGRAAIAELESEVLGDGGGQVTAAAMMAAARERADGAFVVRTVRPRSATGTGAAAATTEDVATRLERIVAFPIDLLRVPEAYRRVPHPLEVMVAYEEEEAELARRSRATTK